MSGDGPSVDLTSCSKIQYEVKDGVHGVAYSLVDGESGWAPVVGKKKKRRIPDLMKHRFPPDHPIHGSNSSQSDSDSTSEEDLSIVIPVRVNADVYYNMVDNTPGLAVNYKNLDSNCHQNKSQTEKVI